MKFILIYVFAFFATISFSQNNCNCDEGGNQLIDSLNGKSKVLVCGYSLDSNRVSHKQATGIFIKNCSSGELLFDHRYDEIFPFGIERRKSDIRIVSYHFIPVGENWEMEAAPIFSRILKLQNEEPVLTDREFVFKYPDEKLSENQIKDLLGLCDFIISKRSNKKRFYPGDEKSLYKLFVGAIFNIGESRNIYERLDIDFEFDGAIAETKGEIYYEYIIQRME